MTSPDRLPLDDRCPELLARVDLVELVERYAGPPARHSGATWTFHCPHREHPDNTPSFTVTGGRWRCWSQCGVGGDAIDLLVWLEPVDKKVAIDRLAGEVGLDRSRPSPPRQDQSRPVTSRPLPAPEGPARPKPSRTVDPDRAATVLSQFCEERCWPKSVADDLGLSVVVDGYDNLRIRFPFRLKGGIVAWQDRAVGSDSRLRWLSSPGPICCPYEVDRLRRAVEVGAVIVVEGVTDVGSVLSGFQDPAVVGIPGASGFKSEWSKAFAGLNVFVVGDNDPAGERFRADVSIKLAGTASAIGQVYVPAPFKDVGEWLAGVGDPAVFAVEFEAAVALTEGVSG